MRKIEISVMAAAFMLLAASYASAASKIVTFDPSLKLADRKSGIESIGGKITKELHIIDALAADFPDNVKNANIYSLNGVRNVEEDKYLKWIEEAPSALPLSYVDDSLSRIKAGDSGVLEPAPAPAEPIITPEEKEIPWGVKRVNAAGAWNTTMGKGVKVAIIDTGMDYSHPDLAAHYAGGYNAVSTGTLPMDDH